VLEPIVLTTESWPESELYLYAIDLFNAGYYWEAHEVLEAIWHGAGRESEVGRFAQGLIQAAAALLKASMGETASARRLAEAASQKLLGGAAALLGVQAHGLAADLNSHVTVAGGRRPSIVLSDPSAGGAMPTCD
jgi:predicted metal-dependent hydrolase